MAVFWLLVFVIAVISAWLVFWVASRHQNLDMEGNEKLKLSVFRENIQELQSELNTGDLDSNQLENIRSELELSLLQEVNSESEDQPLVSESNHKASHKSLLILTTILVCLSVFLYFYLGNPQVIEMSGLGGTEVYSEEPGEYQPSTQMIALMEQHLGKNPEDVNGLYFLASNYIGLSDYENAANALDRLYQVTGDNPQVLVSYIDVLVRLNNGSFAGRATELIERAVMIAPDNYSALLFAGLAAEESGDYRKANGYYKRLLPVLEGNPQLLNTINMLIANSEMQMQEGDANEPSAQPEDSTVSVKLSVSIADELNDEVEQSDTVFIYAQSISGNAMPLAVYRTQVSELPIEITLDDSLSMMPTHKISNFNEVKVQARISKSGTAEVSSGDLIGLLENVQVPGAEVLSLIINSKVP